MIVTIVGVGGVGGYIGLRLAESGDDVRFLARGRTVDALRSRGLSVATPAGIRTLSDVRVSESASDLGQADLIIVTVKIYDLAAVAKTLGPLLGRETAVLPLQNGVDAHDIITEALQHDLVLKGTVSIKSHVSAPGVIVCKSPFCRIKVGPGHPSAAIKAAAVAEHLKQSDGIDAVFSRHIDRELWLKFLMLSSFSAVSCMARATIGEVRANRDAYALVVDAAEEATRVGRALGIDLPNDIGEAVYKQIVDMPRDGRPSMLEDLEAGRRLELDWLSGAVVRLGAKVGVPTPIHSVAHAALSIHAQGHAR